MARVVERRESENWLDFEAGTKTTDLVSDCTQWRGSHDKDD